MSRLIGDKKERRLYLSRNRVRIGRVMHPASGYLAERNELLTVHGPRLRNGDTVQRFASESSFLYLLLASEHVANCTDQFVTAFCEIKFLLEYRIYFWNKTKMMCYFQLRLKLCYCTAFITSFAFDALAPLCKTHASRSRVDHSIFMLLPFPLYMFYS